MDRQIDLAYINAKGEARLTLQGIERDPDPMISPVESVGSCWARRSSSSCQMALSIPAVGVKRNRRIMRRRLTNFLCLRDEQDLVWELLDEYVPLWVKERIVEQFYRILRIRREPEWRYVESDVETGVRYVEEEHRGQLTVRANL